MSLRNPRDAATTLIHHPLTRAIDRLLPKEDGAEWLGTPSALLEALAKHVPDNLRQSRGVWPANPNGLSHRLIKLEPALQILGLELAHYVSSERSIHIMRRHAVQAAA